MILPGIAPGSAAAAYEWSATLRRFSARRMAPSAATRATSSAPPSGAAVAVTLGVAAVMVGWAWLTFVRRVGIRT